MQNNLSFKEKVDNPVIKATKMTAVAEEIVAEIIFCPGSIDALGLEEKLDSFAIVKDYCRDIMYVQVEAAPTVPQQVQTTAEVIKDIIDNYRNMLQGLGVTFYFNKRYYEKWKMRQIEQAYTLRLQAAFGDGLHREFYHAEEDLKLEFKVNPSVSLFEQSNDLKTA